MISRLENGLLLTLLSKKKYKAMRIRIINILLIAGLIGIFLTSCTKHQTDESNTGDTLWHIALTKSGVHTNEKTTFRANLLNYGTGRLVADGSYSGYYYNINDKFWLTPCRTNDAGDALDGIGNVVSWSLDPDDWFAATDKDSQYALRSPNMIQYLTTPTLNFSMVLTSPAVRMEEYLPAGKMDIEDNRKWGVPLDRKKAIFVSDHTPETGITATYFHNEYDYSFEPVLRDRRSKITVKIACGALTKIDVNAVYFKNVMSRALYMPQIGWLPLVYKPFENYIFDGNDGTLGYDPLVSYYQDNTYPASAGQPAGAGDKFFVPAADPDVHLVQRDGQTPQFIENNEWSYFVATDEWVQGDDTKYFFTPIKDFPVFAMDYSEMLDSNHYKYKDQIPQVVILSGEKGNIKTTINLAYNFEPMREYILWLWLSSVYVQGVLTVVPWNIHTHWTNDIAEDTEVVNVEFGHYEVVENSLTVSPWTTSDIPVGDGKIEN